MSLQRVIAAPFKQAGATTRSEQELVVGLSLHRDWFSPDQAKRVIERACTEGLLERDGEEFVPTFDPGDVRIPREFSPDQSILVERTPFERMLAAIVSENTEKREAVAAINRLQRDFDITIEAAAALYATKNGHDVSEEITRAEQELVPEMGT